VTDFAGRHAGRLIVHDREMHLEPYYADDYLVHADDFLVGDTVEVIRGNGPREGDRMGTATVIGFEHGSPVLSVRFREEEVEWVEWP
jgi:hypothetical protein